MKKIILLLISVYFLNSNLYSQTKENPWQLGLSLGISEYSGERGSNLFNFDLKQHTLIYGKETRTMNPYSVFFTVNKYYNSNFDFAFRGYAGTWTYFDKDQFAETGKTFNSVNAPSMGLEFTPRWKFLGKDYARFVPYLTAGIGLRRIDTQRDSLGTFSFIDKKAIYEVNLPVGIGVNVKITERFGLNIQSNALVTSSDRADRTDIKGFTDLAWNHSVGLTALLGKISPGDADGDGVIDRVDICPNTPAGDFVNKKTGCSIDSDKDNIADNKDACPQIAGVFALNGCPDSDGDGVKDSEDKCPNLPGDKSFNGCPDADKDGVDDSKDKCPDLFGVAMFFGCPDTDKDSVQDLEDKCPTTFGLVKFAGCPDTDGDGIEDKLDSCPDVFGYAAFNGCAEGKAPVKAQIVEPVKVPIEVKKPVRELPKKLELTDKLPLKPLEFATNKANVEITYSDTLNSIVNVMKASKNNKLLIVGNADSRGSAEFNKALSLRRAKAVQNYLARKGVNRNRLIIRGDGEENPIDSNETVEGRARNRRVDLILQLYNN